MKAAILAAGRGSRMSVLTENRPKSMLPVAGKPILEWVIDSLIESDIRDIIIVTGHKSEKIKEYFGNGSDKKISIKYTYQKKQLGTGHALSTVREYITNEKFLVINGDVIISSGQFSRLKRYDSQFVMGIKHSDTPERYGCIELSNKNIVKIVEKPKTNKPSLVNSGVYVMNQDVFKAIDNTEISERKEYEITDALQYLIENNTQIKRYILWSPWFSIEYPWDLLTVNEHFLSLINPKQDKAIIEPFAVIKGNVSIGKNTTIKSGSYIEGYTIIGSNCDIGPNCYIRGSTSIGNNVHIGNAVEIKNSIIMNNTNIAHLSYIGDSIIGENCNFGAGTKIANLRLDNKTVRIKIKNEVIDSSKRKLGAIIGDNVKTAINCSINPGTVISSNTYLYH